MKKRMLSAIIVTTMLISVLSGCGAAKTPNASSSGAVSTDSSASSKSDTNSSNKKVGVDLLGSNFSDKSFFESAKSGVDKAGVDFADKITVKATDISSDTSKYQSALQNASDKNPGIIVTGTFEMHDAITTVAPQYPNIKYVIFDNKIDDIPNVYSMLYSCNQSSYLAGMIAAHASKTGTIGFVGGMDNTPIIWDFLVGYIEGAKSVNPNIKITVSYVASFTDTAKAKELALAQINSNKADVIFNVAGAAGAGTLEACANSKVYAIGCDSDQAAQYAGKPEGKYIITSALKRVDNSVYQAIQTELNGKFKSGYEMLGLDKNAVDVVIDDNTKSVCDDAFLKQIADVKAKIVAGSLKVDSAFDKEMTKDSVAALIKSVNPSN